MKNRILSTVAAVALLSGSLYASELDIADQSSTDVDTAPEAVTVAQELVGKAAYNLNIGTTARQIIYKPSVAVADNTYLTFAVTNAVLPAGNYYLYRINGTAAQVGAVADQTVDANGDYKTIKIKIDAGSAVEKDDILVLTTDVTNAAAASANPPHFLVNKGLQTGDKVTLQITSAFNNVELNAPKTKAEVIAEMKNGILVTLTPNPQISTIDVNKDRKEFTGGTTSTDNLKVAAAGLDFNVVLGNSDTFDINITKSSCSGLDDKADSLTFAGLTPVDFNTTNSCYWHFKSNFGDTSLSTGQDIKITVNKDDIIAEGAWKTKMIIDLDEATASDAITLLDNNTTHLWSNNGAQFIVPYMNTQSTYGTYLVVTNENAKEASFVMDVYADKNLKDGKAQSAPVCTNVSLGVLPPHSTKTYYPADFNNAIDGTTNCANFSTTNQRFMAKFTAVAPTNDVHAAAFQKDGANGKRAIAVLSKNGDWKE